MISMLPGCFFRDRSVAVKAVETPEECSVARRTGEKLPRSFYDRPTLEVAPDLLGKWVVYSSSDGLLSGRIVEVEAYIGRDDPACHAAPGPTRRNEVMFGQPGFSYIYLIYGMYRCLNFVTERKGSAAAVLLRAAEPGEGMDIMQRNSPPQKSPQGILSGPGKFCRSFGLTVKQNALDLTGDSLFIEDRHEPEPRVERSSRIGISAGTRRQWRFFDADSGAVSGK